MVAKLNLIKDHKTLLTELKYAIGLSNTPPLNFPKVKQQCDELYQHPLIAYVAFSIRCCTGELAAVSFRVRYRRTGPSQQAKR